MQNHISHNIISANKSGPVTYTATHIVVSSLASCYHYIVR